MNYLITINFVKNNQLQVNKQITGSYIDNKLNFNFDNMNHQLDFNHQIFTRENDEYLFTLDIINNNSQLKLKKENYNFSIPVENATLIKNDNNCLLTYLLETDDETVNLKLTWEEPK